MGEVTVTILGCGGSGGVPTIGEDWGNCDPSNPRNRRLRTSALIETEGLKILIDTGPDLRQQLLACGTGAVNAILYTHSHADHTHGIDDLRHVCRLHESPIDIYGSEKTLAELSERFSYVFQPLKADFFYKPHLIPHIVTGDFQVGSVPVRSFVQDHGFGLETLGFRIGNLAYSTDVKSLDDHAFECLEGVDTWIVDCVQEMPHPTHSHLAQTLEWVERAGVRQAWLVHMNGSLDYDSLLAKCPEHVRPAWDGLRFTVS